MWLLFGNWACPEGTFFGSNMMINYVFLWVHHRQTNPFLSKKTPNGWNMVRLFYIIFGTWLTQSTHREAGQFLGPTTLVNGGLFLVICFVRCGHVFWIFVSVCFVVFLFFPASLL